jgi:hypothetical protein
MGKIVVKSLRELDALVAERVMRWKLHTQFTPPRWSVPGAPPQFNMPTECPPYSTDIAAAWEVVEALEGKTILELDEHGAFRSRENGGFQLQGPYIRSQWRAGWLERDHEYYLAEEVAATAPLAICLAALKAVGVEVELQLP